MSYLLLPSAPHSSLSYETAFAEFTQKSAPRVLWVSALNDATAVLTSIVQQYCNGDDATAIRAFGEFKKAWQEDAEKWLPQSATACISQARDLFTEVEWLLYDAPVREHAYYFDQMVSLATLATTLVFSYYLHEKGIENIWIDPRDIIRTDDQFGRASLDMAFTQTQLQKQLQSSQNKMLLIPAGIGASDENENTRWEVEERKVQRLTLNV